MARDRFCQKVGSSSDGGSAPKGCDYASTYDAIQSTIFEAKGCTAGVCHGEGMDGEGLEGDLDLRGFLGLSEEVRKGYRTVRIDFRVKTHASATTLRELAQFSPVYDIVSNSLPVEVSVDTYK